MTFVPPEWGNYSLGHRAGSGAHIYGAVTTSGCGNTVMPGGMMTLPNGDQVIVGRQLSDAECEGLAQVILDYVAKGSGI